MNDQPSTLHPSTTQLLKAIAFALVAGIAVLVVAVLPAEFGVDPTGLGTRLGLTALRAPAEQAPAPVSAPVPAPAPAPEAAAPAATVIRQAGPFHDDKMTIVLAPQKGAEIKAHMTTGSAFVFSWTADGPVNFDMHGEQLNAKQDEFTSYWKDREQTSGHGSFVAPFDGTHGWYWRNRGDKPVTVTVRVSGYFDKLYQP
jgi:hypothetical protein